MQGRIIKAIAGFYYVYAQDGETYACRARGLFRKNGEKPLVGDLCRMEVTDLKDMEGNVTELLPRKNELLRPNVANIDQALIVFSLTHPSPSLVLLDKLLLQYTVYGIPSVICFTKEDLAEEEMIRELAEIYAGAGYPLLFICAKTGQGMEELKALLKDRTTSVAGPSGVGKSTLINSLQDKIVTETGSISKKSERGKHTTRHSEIIPIPLSESSYIMDTPGFSSFEVLGITPETLAEHYREFALPDPCYYMPCSHIHEPGCLVRERVEKGLIHRGRYENYIAIYGELKERRRY